MKALPLISNLQVPPTPTPLSFAATPGRIGDADVVVLQIQSPVGVLVFFLDPANAKAVGDEISRVATKAGTGIILSPKVLHDRAVR